MNIYQLPVNAEIHHSLPTHHDELPHKIESECPPLQPNMYNK